MKSKHTRSIFFILSVFVVISLLLIGCSNSGDSQGTKNSNTNSPSSSPSQSTAKDKEPITITMMNLFNSETAPKDDDPDILKIQELTNVKLDVTWVPTNVYNERMSVTLSSGDMPQVLMVYDMHMPTIINAVRNGMFWELGPYLDEFPYLQTFNEIAMNNAKIDGKNYALIRPRFITRDGLFIRQDWLDNLGIDVPETIDEVYEVWKAFKHNDPDLNGVDDTYGLTTENTLPIDVLLASFGAPNKWEYRDGKFIKSEETEEFLDTLKFIKKLYDEELINRDFSLSDRNVARRDLYNNLSGSYFGAVDATLPFIEARMAEVGNPVDLAISGPIEGPGGKRSMSLTGYLGVFMIPTSSVKTEEELRDILAFFNEQRKPEVEEQLKQFILDNESKPVEERFNVDNLRQFLVNDLSVYPLGDTEKNNTIIAKMHEFAEYVVIDPSMNLISPTNTERGGELNTILEDAKIKFIMGEIDEAGWKSAVDQWLNAGGAQIAKEYAEVYQE